MVGRVGFEPTITGARDQYVSCLVFPGILDQAVPTVGWSGPPPLLAEGLYLQKIRVRPRLGQGFRRFPAVRYFALFEVGAFGPPLKYLRTSPSKKMLTPPVLP